MRKNGLYFGEFAGEVVLVRVDFFTEDLTLEEYDREMERIIPCQPFGKLPPLQDSTLNRIKNLTQLQIFHEPDHEEFNTWMTWAFDWNAVYQLWYENDSKVPFEYVHMFNQELEQQWENYVNNN